LQFFWFNIKITVCESDGWLALQEDSSAVPVLITSAPAVKNALIKTILLSQLIFRLSGQPAVGERG
jgi:hypothetical protein